MEDPDGDSRVSNAQDQRDSDLDLHSDSAVLTLFRCVLERLPRELRDMVYTHLLGAPVVAVRRESGGPCDREETVPYFNAYPGCEDDHLACEHPCMIVLFQKKSAVAQEILQELVETWYKVSRFDIGDEYDSIERFLHEDRWALGLKPHKLIRKIAIDAVPDIPEDYTAPWTWKFSDAAPQLMKSLSLRHTPCCIHIILYFPESETSTELWNWIRENDNTVGSECAWMIPRFRTECKTLLPAIKTLSTSIHRVHISCWDGFDVKDLDLSDDAVNAKFAKDMTAFKTKQRAEGKQG